MAGVGERARRLYWRIRAAVSANLAALWIFVPIGALAPLLAAYGWWWGVIADGVREQVTELRTAQRALGRDLTWNSLQIEGFPYRVDAILSGPQLTAPDRGLVLNSERVVLHVEPLAVNRLTFSLEGQQSVLYVKEGSYIDGSARPDRASVILTGDAGGLPQAVDLDIARLSGNVTWGTTQLAFVVDRANARLRAREAREDEPLPRVDIAGAIKNLALQGEVDLPLGRSIESVEIDVALRFPETLPEASTTTLVAAWRVAGMPVRLNRFELDWGGISVSASGTIKLDTDALPEGSLWVRLGNHKRILELLEASGWITHETRAAMQVAFDKLSFVSGDPKRRVPVPVRIEQGKVFVLFWPVATLKAQPKD